MPRFSSLSHLECARCRREHDASGRIQVCSCGGPLLARYDLAEAGRSVRREGLAARPQGLWRYHEFLPVRDPGSIASLGECATPVVRLPRSGRDMDVAGLAVKDESVLPTGTFKARGAAVGVSRAAELGVREIVVPTNGNAGAAFAAYGARGGIAVTVVLPEGASDTSFRECRMAGAQVLRVQGSIASAGVAAAAAAARGAYDAGTLREPYRLEGKKTLGYEIADQADWNLPDVLVFPTGGGAGIIAVHKALLELAELGWIDGKFPRLVAVQASGCAPLVDALEQGLSESARWEDPRTVAFGMTVPKAKGDFLILDAVRRTAGTAVSVEDGEILREWRSVAREDGFLACLEGAAALAGVRKLRAQGWIADGERVLALNTGSVLKSLHLFPRGFPEDGPPVAGGGLFFGNRAPVPRR